MFKKALPILTILMILAGLLSACGAAPVAMAQTEEPQPVRTVTVTGSGQAYLTPDIAYINIGVHSEDASAQEAVAENNELSQAVINAIKGFGIANRDIKTVNFSIYPQQRYDNEGNPQELIYVVDNSVYVTVRDLDQIGDLLDAVVESGANSINGIQFDVADKTAALSTARKAAVANAEEIASELAEAAGGSLGAVQSINLFENSPIPMPVFAAKAMDMAESSVPIQSGEMQVSVQVNVVYELTE